MPRPRIYPDHVMTAAERQRRHRHSAPRFTLEHIAEDPQGFARDFRQRLGYRRALDLRDALDKAMDEGDLGPGYLLRR